MCNQLFVIRLELTNILFTIAMLVFIFLFYLWVNENDFNLYSLLSLIEAMTFKKIQFFRLKFKIL